MTSLKEQQTAGREKILAALLGALAIALPQVFHVVGLGAAFLPMHLPILLAGMVARPSLAASVGLLAPAMSSLLVGMPPVPLVPLMMAELATLGAAAALFHRRLRLPVWAAAPLAVAARVAVTFLAVTFVGDALRLPGQASATAWIATGIPGIVLQLIAAPAALRVLRRNTGQAEE